jgi:deaminated glutathione amidase
MSSFVAAVVQLSSGADRPANLARASALIRTAADRGAKLVVLPEVFPWRGPRADETGQAEAIPGPVTEAMAAVARETGVHLCMGSMLETGGGDRSFNTSIVLGPSGDILGRYRKIHLFDVELPGRVCVRESDARAPGEDVVVVPTPLGRLGMSICYDLRFPELYRRLVQAGAEILLLPSAFTFPTGAAHWEVLCRARAIENQCWLLAANQTGQSPHGFHDYGNSLIVDPWGTVVARVGDGEGIALAEVDLTQLARVRSEMPCLDHVRLR